MNPLWLIVIIPISMAVGASVLLLLCVVLSDEVNNSNLSEFD